MGDDRSIQGRAGRRGPSRHEGTTGAGAANIERILGAALEVFASHGFHGSRVDAIASAAGLSKPNLLYYFRTKEDLYRAVLTRAAERWVQPFAEISLARPPPEALAAYIRCRLAFSREDPAASRLVAVEALQGAHHLKAVMTGPMTESVQAAAEAIEAWVGGGELRPLGAMHALLALCAITQPAAAISAFVDAPAGANPGCESLSVDAQTVLARIFLQGVLPDRDSAEPARADRASIDP